MTNTKKQPSPKGDRPTHSLMVNSDQFGDPVKIRLAALWNNTEKGYMSLNCAKLQLRRGPEAKGDQPCF